MSIDKKIRFANRSDSDSILQIYAPFITDTVITFECKVPSSTAFSERMANIQRQYPWLVCEINDEIVGYAYASPFKEREAYEFSVDFSIYINPTFHRKNIGKALYATLFEIVKLQGYFTVYAGVTLPNSKSESLHESFGFKPIGVYHNVGFKLNAWHNVIWYELKIKDYIQSPAKPKSIHEISNTNEIREILANGEQMIKID